MASYPIKMMKDENNKPFVPLVSTEGIKNPQGQTLDSLLNTKIGPSNLHGGDNISITTSGYDCFINLDLPSSLNVIDNLTTSVSGQGALDARQGKILKDSIPIVDNDISSTSTTHALSAYQGYVLNNKFNNYLPLTGGAITNTLSVNGDTSLNSNVNIGGELKVEGNIEQKKIHTSVVYEVNGGGDVSFTAAIPFNKIVYDYGNCWSITKHAFVAPKDGLYLANFWYFSNTITTTSYIRPGIMKYDKNGNFVTQKMVTGNAPFCLSSVFYLQKGEMLKAGSYTSNYTVSFYAQTGHNGFDITYIN